MDEVDHLDAIIQFSENDVVRLFSAIAKSGGIALTMHQSFAGAGMWQFTPRYGSDALQQSLLVLFGPL
ncbi:MAG: hypothetical protein MI920_05250 [Kiloniellales bacterium]|nr:hypothetical protein [Kiloniellales bacterium]